MKKQALWFNTGLPMIIGEDLSWSRQSANFHADIIEGSNKIQYPKHDYKYDYKFRKLVPIKHRKKRL